MLTMTTKRSGAREEYCFGCECLLLTPNEKLGPICRECFKKTKARDPLMRAAIKKSLVVVVPAVCPHESERRHSCRTKFNVIVFNRKLEPIQITIHRTMRGADKEAKRVQRRIDRKERGR